MGVEVVIEEVVGVVAFVVGMVQGGGKGVLPRDGGR